jgi:hypothetical protein
MTALALLAFEILHECPARNRVTDRHAVNAVAAWVCGRLGDGTREEIYIRTVATNITNPPSLYDQRIVSHLPSQSLRVQLGYIHHEVLHRGRPFSPSGLLLRSLHCPAR